MAAQAGEVAGTVYDARGQKAADVELALDGQTAITGADGAFRFADVRAGEHQIVAGSQRVAVTVAESGETRRNVMLLSRSARTAVTGETIDTAAADAVLAQAMRLADAMLAEAARLPERRIADSEG